MKINKGAKKCQKKIGQNFLSALYTLILLFFVSANISLAQSANDNRICNFSGEYAVVAVRPLSGDERNFEPPPNNSLRDRANIQSAHEHIFFCKDRKVVENVGFGPLSPGKFAGQGTLVRNESTDNYTVRSSVIYKSDPMRQAVVLASFNFSDDNKELKHCQLNYQLFTKNCQYFVNLAIQEYYAIIWPGEWTGTLTQPGRKFKYSIKNC